MLTIRDKAVTKLHIHIPTCLVSYRQHEQNKKTLILCLKIENNKRRKPKNKRYGFLYARFFIIMSGSHQDIKSIENTRERERV